MRPVAAAQPIIGGSAPQIAPTSVLSVLRVFSGADQGPHRDALLMGAALVLELQGTVSSPADGVAMAATAIDDGSAGRFLDRLRQHFEAA